MEKPQFTEINIGDSGENSAKKEPVEPFVLAEDDKGCYCKCKDGETVCCSCTLCPGIIAVLIAFFVCVCIVFAKIIEDSSTKGFSSKYQKYNVK